SANYTPVNVTFANVSGTGKLTVKTTSEQHPNISTSGISSSKDINRYWTMTKSGVGFENYSATFNFVSGDIPGSANTSNFVVRKYSGSTWTTTTIGAITGTSTQATGMTSFSDFVIGELISTDAIISAGTLATVSLGGTFTGGQDIAGSSALSVTVPDASKTNAVLALTKGNANSVVKYVTGAQPVNDASYTNTYASGSTQITVADGDVIWLLVTAEDATTKKYYKITVTVSAAETTTAISSQSTATQTQCLNGTFTPITVTATGTGTLTYQWYRNTSSGNTGGTSLGTSNGANTSSYTPQATTAGTLYYYCIVSGTSGSATSAISGAFVVNLPSSATINYSGNPFCSGSGAVLVSRTGTPGGTYTAVPTGLSIDSSTGTITTTGSTPGTYTVTYTMAASGGCGIVTTTTSVTINLDGYWTGSINTDWNNIGNWACNQLPTLTTNVIITNGKPRYPTISTGSPGMSGNLTIESNSSVTVTGNVLQIAGSISNSGTFTATAGTVEMKGSNAQSIGANVFAGNTIMNLTINNSAGVTLQGPLSVTGIVKAALGNLTSGGNLTLVSTASQTALINGAGAGEVLGDVTMQRYLSSASGYKYVSSPFSNATVAAFSPYLSTSATIPTFYTYDEDNHRDSSGVAIYQSGWVKYPAGTLSPMSGYAANFGSASSAITINITGTVNNGSKSVTLFNHNRKYTKGFNLVGNPYPSPIDWDAASGWTKTYIDNALYYFNTNTSDQYEGTYSTYINSISSDGSATNIIPSMQGFFVHVSDDEWPVTGILALNNSVRVTDMTHSFIKSAGINSIPLLRLTAGFSDDPASADPMVIYFDEKASAEFDGKLDALKLMNTAVKVPNFYALSADANRLSINAIPYPDSMTVVPLGLKTEQSGWISFKATSIENMPSDLHIYFLDNKTGIRTELLQSTGCRLNIIAGTEEKRFSLIFSKRVLSDTQVNNGAFIVYSSGGKLIVSFAGSAVEKGYLVINNMIGQELLRRQIVGTGVHEFDPQLKAGVYVVSFYSGRSIYSKKVLITNQ
ncbi:MAG: hypothetical protein IMZ64_09570, partial [Bacteroidetes bacterium]|nr:hypothetical protein [Bacteroidota bacterium]